MTVYDDHGHGPETEHTAEDYKRMSKKQLRSTRAYHRQRVKFLRSCVSHDAEAQAELDYHLGALEKMRSYIK